MAESRTNASLRVGVARADITPPVGIRSAGFAARGPLTRLHDPLYATALVAAGDRGKVAIVAAQRSAIECGERRLDEPVVHPHCVGRANHLG